MYNIKHTIKFKWEKSKVNLTSIIIVIGCQSAAHSYSHHPRPTLTHYCSIVCHRNPFFPSAGTVVCFHALFSLCATIIFTHLITYECLFAHLTFCDNSRNERPASVAATEDEECKKIKLHNYVCLTCTSSWHKSKGLRLRVNK